MNIEWIYLVTGLLLGVLAAFLVTKYYIESKRILTRQQKENLDQEFNRLQLEANLNREKYESLRDDYDGLKAEIEVERNKALELNKKLIASESDYKNLLEKLDSQKKEVEKLQEKFSIEFKNLANEILEEKSRKCENQID